MPGRYYTCFSRQRYGAAGCTAERLPADELDAAVLEALFHIFGDHDLFERAVRAAADRAGALRAQHEEELSVVEAEMTKTAAAIDRYLLAFESGTLPEAQCGERVRSLAAKAGDLRQRREDVTVALAATAAVVPTVEQLTDVRAEIKAATDGGTVTTKKALLQALVEVITVEGRHAIQPVFRVPQCQETTAAIQRFASCSDWRPRQDSNLRPAA